MKTHTTSSAPLVRARGLTKVFGLFRAVDQINFDVWPGEIVGFLGPNGAGKTTTIRMLLNLLNPTFGEVTVFGMSYADRRTAILQMINASSGSLSLPGKLPVEEALRVFGDLYGLRRPQSRIDSVIQQFDLDGLRRKPLYSLSTGQQVRAAMAKAFLNHPRLLLLDEPTASLDPDVADRIRTRLLQTVEEEKTTVFLTSHNMREVEQVCSRVLFINNGRIEAEGTPAELARRVKQWNVFLRTRPPVTNVKALHLPPDAEVTLDGDEIKVVLDKGDIGPFLTRLVQEKHRIDSISIKEPTLEEFFVRSVRQSS